MPTIKLTIEDTLAVFNNRIGGHTVHPNNIQTNDWFFAIPDGWLTEEGTMSAEHLEHIFRWMYGPQWRSGNADGSKYIVVRHTIGRVDPAAWRAAGQRQRLDVSGNVTRLK